MSFVETWMDDAACRGDEITDYFHRDENVNKVETCRPCPVAAECLAYALVNLIDHGVWGGLTPNERTAIRKRARRAAA